LVGSVAAFFVDLYTDQVRILVESAWLRISIRSLAIIAVVMASCAATWLLRDQMWRRRRARESVVSRSFDISVDDFDDDLPQDVTVIGRQLRYIERATNSSTLVVFLHGLGLDANDFRRFMALTDAHTVALTLFGFNADEARDDRYRPIGLKPHTDLISGALNNLQRQYPNKDLVLVGFSLGADLMLRLGELWSHHRSRAPKIRAAVLLDPNVNSSTMNISSAIAKMDTTNPLGELKRIMMQTSTPAEFHNICEYLHKITSKDLEQIKRHAGDFVEYWREDPAGVYRAFLQRLGVLSTLTNSVRVVFSSHYEAQFNGLVAASRATGTRATLQVTPLDHFDLIGDERLKMEINAVSDKRPRTA
jgi:pimeloyl-ACP methyl ester carboxylesterase